MKRTSRILVQYDDGTIAEAIVKTIGTPGLTRYESQEQHDTAIDRVVESFKHLPYAPAARHRNVSVN